MATYHVWLKIENNGTDEVSAIDVLATSEDDAIMRAYKMLQALGNATGVQPYDLHAELVAN